MKIKLTDKEIIDKLGGARAIGDHLNLKNPHQTVNNWRKRGIPPKRKIEYPHLFLTNTPPNLKEISIIKNKKTGVNLTKDNQK